MTPLAIVALVVGILLLVGLVLVAVLVPVFHRLRTRADQFEADFDAELAASGEAVLLGPEPGNYRGGTGRHSAVKGNGTIVLTDRRLVFRKLSGGLEEVPREAIIGVRVEKSFLGSRVGGQTHLVVSTTEPAEIGFFVEDLPAWQQALTPSSN